MDCKGHTNVIERKSSSTKKLAKAKISKRVNYHEFANKLI